MQIEQAIEVAKTHIKWQKDGVPVPYEKLNSGLLCEALVVLIDEAELSQCECGGLSVK